MTCIISIQPGAIDKFEVDTQRIIEIVARDTEDKGAFEDAVRLYDLAKVICLYHLAISFLFCSLKTAVKVNVLFDNSYALFSILCGKAVNGLERILCVVLVKRNSGKHG